MKIVGKDQIRTFFDWPHPYFTKLSDENFVITDQYFTGNTVITNGYFNPFKWQDIEVEAMQFSSQLVFNKDGKIIKHIDWINYPAYLIDYQTRLNSNDWIPSNSKKN